jgi:OmcA/MtrC family decaheme c-type cytochrome
VTIDSPPVVNFTVLDQNNAPVIGLTAGSTGNVRFTMAKLVVPNNGDGNSWQSYVNRTASGAAGQVIQATYDRDGTLVDHGDGTYTYTFATDVTNVTTPIPVPYDPTTTTRVAIQFSGSLNGSPLPAANPTLDFVPNGSQVTTTNDIVTTSNCNECHTQLHVHGANPDVVDGRQVIYGGRIETKYCATCHNPGTTDAATGNSLDFKVFIHKLHLGADLLSVKAGTPYKIGNADFSTVVFPQDIRHCAKCHNQESAPNGDFWQTVPTMQACTSCHEDVSFSTSPPPGTRPHGGGPQTGNGACAACHGPNGIAPTVDAHQIFTENEAKRYEYKIVSVSDTAPGQKPTVVFQVLKDGQPMTLTESPDWTSSGSRLAIDFGWDTVDYNNTGSGSIPALPISIPAVTGGVRNATDNGDGTLSVTSTVALPDASQEGIPAAQGTGAAGIEGHPVEVNSNPFDPAHGNSQSIPVRSVVQYVPITDSTAQPRTQVADIANCAKCHDEALNLHGSNRNNNIDLCVICHNPNETDIQTRPAAANNYADFTATGVDGKREQAINFKTLIHNIHASGPDESQVPNRASGITVYGFNGNPNSFDDVRFPGILNDCAICHINTANDRTYQVPLVQGTLGTTTQTASPDLAGDVQAIEAALATPDDDLKVTPMAAACSSCHNDQTTMAHITQNGGAFDVTQAMIDSGAVFETCTVCHSAGSLADVQAVHGVP